MKKTIEKQKLLLVPNRSNLIFTDSTVGKESEYKIKLLEATQQEQLICILKSDKYMLQQFKNYAKKLKLRLVYAVDGEDLLIKPIQLGGEVRRLLLYLREPRTSIEIDTKARDLEIDVDSTLEDQIKRGFVLRDAKDRYKLTEKGFELVK